MRSPRCSRYSWRGWPRAARGSVGASRAHRTARSRSMDGWSLALPQLPRFLSPDLRASARCMWPLIHTLLAMPAFLLMLRFAGVCGGPVLPTFLMGGTLPVLVRGLTRNAAELGARLSRLYWINTAGAVAGTFRGWIFFSSRARFAADSWNRRGPEPGRRILGAVSCAPRACAGLNFGYLDASAKN